MALLVWTVLVLWILLLPADRIAPRKTVASEVALLLFTLLIHITAHPLAYGKATPEGLQYRRYFRQHLLPWSAFSRVAWRAGSISLRLRDENYPANRLDFIDTTAWRDLWLKFRGGTPQKVEWLHRSIPRQ